MDASGSPLDGAFQAIAYATHGDPFAVLGPHGDVVRAFLPQAQKATLVTKDGQHVAEMSRVHSDGLFEGPLNGTPADGYRIAWETGGQSHTIDDPYRFGPLLGELDVYLLAEGRHQRAYNVMGAHPIEHEGVKGASFAVWAPGAARVSVVGAFNDWDGRRHPMRARRECGVWEVFIPGLEPGVPYKYEILSGDHRLLPLKADPYAFYMEMRPATASILTEAPALPVDEAWTRERAARTAHNAPVSVYEVHLGSWMRGEGNSYLTYDELAERLIPYVLEMGFTHLELMPVSEHPFDGSWGYQPIGLYAPTSRHGDPESFARFVTACHEAGIGVILDWVPGHFPTDAHGLGRFDGTALYEHEDPRQGFHQDWNTLIYNYGRTEVSNFLTANGLFWFDRYQIDGLRVDAVASMLYLDYSREHDQWVPNKYGGRENLEAIEFLQSTNYAGHVNFGGIVTIAEESTAWPGVSKPTEEGGLGFDYKWNMGWMHDTLEFMKTDPLYRKHHHDQMTFGLVYAFSENFVLPLSHDEVVHGKGSLLNKMPGDAWQKFANLRAYYGFMWGHPGKKLLFMGGEFAQGGEWNHDHSIDWHLLEVPEHQGMQKLVSDLNKLYRSRPALHQLDTKPEGFSWVVGDDRENSVFAFLRHGEGAAKPVLVISNMTPNVVHDYRLGVPSGGTWVRLLSTDDSSYGGSGVGEDRIEAAPEPSHGREHSIGVTLPPLATVFFEVE
ncbi:1,4-alpha-glucan branching protein GlgB [Parvularcula dongshanensis]|uniref:1,4-alpha-glucan branching enzyme GlgB n=1 Tax=Parvularcula dongshanensis TaxID=1173995 RepID=A0A840I4G1_9PROT|nr:1,4-alpha-glucan branching protein GlgB [Parvularcula dongshanensis]MBB4659058.1 1,4-alpha-glucan branching enzyme [Parvularcula dongshanensis]